MRAHANAHHMAVAFEDTAGEVARLRAAGGEITACATGGCAPDFD